MPAQSDIVTLTTDRQFDAARASHSIIHDGAPASFWEDALHRHPIWAAEGAHRAVFDGDRPVSLTSLGVWEQRFGATTLTAGEIGLVGTLPEYRGRGLSRLLMESWIDSMREQRVPLMYLFGIPNFYERWDFQYAVPDYVNAFLSITHDPLAACAVREGTVRPLNLDTDTEQVLDLIALVHRDVPCSPLIDARMLRYMVGRSDAHGVDWRVIEDDRGDICAVVRWKRWAEGIGPQASGAVTFVATRDEAARGMLAAVLLDHLDAANQAELALAIPPHGPFGEWLFPRGARAKSDSSIFRGGYAGMYRINDLVTVLNAARTCWDEPLLIARHAGTTVTLRAGRDDEQRATIIIADDEITILPGDGGVEIEAPPAVTVPWVTGWRSAGAWLDRLPYPALPGPPFDPGDPDKVSPEVAALLRDLFLGCHPFIGDTYQGG